MFVHVRAVVIFVTTLRFVFRPEVPQRDREVPPTGKSEPRKPFEASRSGHLEDESCCAPVHPEQELGKQC